MSGRRSARNSPKVPVILAARANNLGPFHGPQILILILLVGGGVFFLRRRAKHRPDAHGRTSSDGPRGVPGEEANVTMLGPSARTGAGTSTSEVTLERSLQPGDAPAVAPSRPTRAISFGGDDPDGWAVETHGLTKRFDTNVAVDDVELLVPRGSAFGYLGPNGAGKTTLIRTLLGLTSADAGTMSLLGIPVPHERREALARVGAIVDEPRFTLTSPGVRTFAFSPRHAEAIRTSASACRSHASVSRSGPTTRCLPTRWACVNASASLPACSQIRTF